MLDAKPIPGADKVVASFSPNHGRWEHMGYVTVIDPSLGPDARQRARTINPKKQFRDPWGFSEDCFLAADEQAAEGAPGIRQLGRQRQQEFRHRLRVERAAA